MSRLPDCVQVETGRSPTASVIWLHGLGADGHDFEPVVAEFGLPRDRAWRFVFPHAPVRPITINQGMAMRAWYDIKGVDIDAETDVIGFKDSDTLVRNLLAREVERGVSAERMVLAGFSQGGAMTLYSGLRYPTRLAGLIGLSCYLALPDRLDAERTKANARTPIFLAHGTQDPLVPITLGIAARDALHAAGHPVEWHAYAVPHAVCAEEIQAIREFLLQALP
jgi:phospholipase/carboxylesterase